MQNLEERCKGIADGLSKVGGKSKQLPLPPSSFGNPTAVAQAIVSTLRKDPAVDGIFMISAADADSAYTAIQQAGAEGRQAVVCDRPTAVAARLLGGDAIGCVR
nr:hypothetical protein [Mesorhizobium sp. B4-1-4]